jgi:alkylhydroperoxidase family enzyme
VQAALREQFDDAQIMELLLGVALYHGMSKVLIVLGLEPESMPVTQLPTPGSHVAA